MLALWKVSRKLYNIRYVRYQKLLKLDGMFKSQNGIKDI